MLAIGCWVVIGIDVVVMFWNDEVVVTFWTDEVAEMTGLVALFGADVEAIDELDELDELDVTVWFPLTTTILVTGRAVERVMSDM